MGYPLLRPVRPVLRRRLARRAAEDTRHLLPSLNKARRSAMTVACASNMRQIGLAAQMYMNANAGRMLAGGNIKLQDLATGQSEGTGQYSFSSIRWFDALASYVSGSNYRRSIAARTQYTWPIGTAGDSTASQFGHAMGVYFCPEDREEIDGYPDRRDNEFLPSSYGITAIAVNLYRMGGDPTIQNGGTDDALSSALSALNLSHPKRSTELAWMTEIGRASWYNVYGSLDEHNFALNTSGGLYDHSGALNYLFLDGHVEALKVPPHALGNFWGTTYTFRNKVKFTVPTKAETIAKLWQ